MKLGIISDTHDRMARTSAAIALLLRQGVAGLVHCGDFTRPDIILECAGVPGWFVFGNNDDDVPGLSRAISAIGGVNLGKGGEFELGGKRIAVTHGDSARELQRLASAAPDVLFYGHTHFLADEIKGSTRWINPGALHRASRWTVALIDLEDNVLQVLDVPESV